MPSDELYMKCDEFRKLWKEKPPGKLDFLILMGMDGHLDSCMDCVHWAFPIIEKGKKPDGSD